MVARRYAPAPLEFVPRDLYSWHNRFDDVRREYRTIYCAEHRKTCLREVLADLRPNARVRSDYAQFQLAQGIAREDLHQPSRTVTAAWREGHALIRARAVRSAPLVDLDDVSLLDQLERDHADLLVEHGMDHLDISAIRSRNRVVTQTISRTLYDRGAAGILFRSNRDDLRCLALMETRATLEAAGDKVSLAEDLPELAEVCDEYGLVLSPT